MKAAVLVRVLAVVAASLVLSCVESDDVLQPSRPARKKVAPIDLSKYERKVFSQFGEDGVIEKIFQLIQPTSHYAVEFGAANGVALSNTRNLFVNHGWSGLLIEGDEVKAKRLERNYRYNYKVKTLQAWVYPGNIEILFEENGVPEDLDLLSIDIDSNDYYVWNVIHRFHPKVVLIEINPFVRPPQRMVINFHPLNYHDGSKYFGASIQSMYELGKKKGYEAIYCSSGANLFLVQKEYYPRFGIENNAPVLLWREPPDWVQAMNYDGDPHLEWDHVRIEKKYIHDR